MCINTLLNQAEEVLNLMLLQIEIEEKHQPHELDLYYTLFLSHICDNRQGAGELPDGDEQVVHLCAGILDDQTEHDCH